MHFLTCIHRQAAGARSWIPDLRGPGGQTGHAHCSAVSYHCATRAGIIFTPFYIRTFFGKNGANIFALFFSQPSLILGLSRGVNVHIRIWKRATEMEITVRCGYAASIGSLVWALNKRESDRKGRLTGGRWLGTRPGVNDLRSAWRNGRTIAIEQHFYWYLFKLLLAKNI